MSNQNNNNARNVKREAKQEAKKEVKALATSGPRDASYGADVAAMQKFQKERARSMTTPVAIVHGNEEAKPKRGTKSEVKAARQNLKFHPEKAELKSSLAAWCKLLADPFNRPFAKCPVNYNPVPTPRSTPLRLTSNSSISVVNGECAQMSLFPGHGGEWTGNPAGGTYRSTMDGVSYHSMGQVINGVRYAVGPVFVNADPPAIGYTVTGLMPGAVSLSSVAAASPVSFDVDAPYQANTTTSGHTRWKLIAMGIRIMNVTQRETRGGNVVVVQPSSKVAYGSQREMASDPTFRITRTADTSSLTITWIPRPEDLAFWHMPDTNALAPIGNSMNAAAINIFFNTDGTPPGVGSQTYDYELVTHWEIAGFSVNSIATPTIVQPADRSVVEPAIVHLRSSSGSANLMSSVASAMATTVSPFAHAAVDSAMEFLTTTAAAGARTAAKHAAQFASTLL